MANTIARNCSYSLPSNTFSDSKKYQKYFSRCSPAPDYVGDLSEREIGRIKKGGKKRLNKEKRVGKETR